MKLTLFRRAPSLVCYWSGEQMIFENYRAGERVSADPLACDILNFFDDWKPVELLFPHLPQFSRSSLRKAVGQLAACSLLERHNKNNRALDGSFDGWKEWDPAAGFFHFSTKDIRFTFDPTAERKFLRTRMKAASIPPSVKKYAKAQKVSLPPPVQEGEIPRVLLARRTWRKFSSRPVTLMELSTLLGLTWRIQGWLDTPCGRLPLKTSPSGGARHPIEAYVVASRVENLPHAIFHYAPDRHHLELMKPSRGSAQLGHLLAGQDFFGRAAAVIFMTAVFSREQWKYPTARAYRVIQLDAGHLCQTFCLVATWLGLAPFCTAALADSRIEKTLGIDGVSESVIYAVGVGRPPD